jgi:ABC-2 type transport system permease protein
MALPPPPSVAVAIQPSRWRAWWNLVLLSLRRQARAHAMLWVSLGMLGVSALLVQFNTAHNRWNLGHRRSPPRTGATYAQHLTNLELVGQAPWPAPTAAMQFAVVASWVTVAQVTSGLALFSNWIVFSLFATFLLPLWTLSFATEGLGHEREAGTLIWTLVRPIPRPAIYLAKFVAVLPWCIAFSLGGFFLLCWLGGEPGRTAFRLYWQATLLGTLAFAALFHLMGACLRRAGIVALLYAFFLETVAGNLPGHFKRLSVSFYMRCLMFEQGREYGIGPERPLMFQPVSGTTAWLVLAGATLVFLAVGIVVFSRSEYLDVK